MPITEDRDHIRWPADAAVTLVQCGDYECPYCGAAYHERNQWGALRHAGLGEPGSPFHPRPAGG
jgi:hypothetical protein